MAIVRILIEGVGGIGGVVAAGLIKEGYAVTLITSNDKITDAINKDGIRLIKDDNEVAFYTTAHTSLEVLPDPSEFDIAFLIMKADSVENAAKSTLPYLGSDGYLATFQNGIVEYDVAEIVGEDRIVPVTVGFGGTMHEPGIYEKTSPGGFHIGELSGVKTRRIAKLKEILSAVDEVDVTDNMEGVLWSKLAINSTINTLGAITGMTLGDMLSERRVRDLFLNIYREVVDVAHAKGVELEPVATDPYRLYRSKDAGWFKRFIKDLIVRFVGRKYKNLKSSTLQSIERGRKSEIDVLNGFVVDQAQEVGVEVPANRVVTEIMRKIDEGELNYKPENLELVFERLKELQ